MFHFNATDRDGQSPNNEVNYIIDSGDNEQFTVDSSGVLTVSRGLDREKLSSYSLVVLAVDRGSPQNTGTATLSIDVDDVNDVSPEFSKSSDAVTVNENSRGVVYNLTATDPDVNRHLQFALQSATGFDSDQRQVSHLQVCCNVFNQRRGTYGLKFQRAKIIENTCLLNAMDLFVSLENVSLIYRTHLRHSECSLYYQIHRTAGERERERDETDGQRERKRGEREREREGERTAWSV